MNKVCALQPSTSMRTGYPMTSHACSWQGHRADSDGEPPEMRFAADPMISPKLMSTTSLKAGLPRSLCRFR